MIDDQIPVTPTLGWILANNHRQRIVSPGDDESDRGLNNNNNNNRFSPLEDSDESISSTESRDTESVFAIETDAAFPFDADHLIGAVEQAVQIQHIRQVLGGDPIAATDNSAFETAARFIETRFIEAGDVEFNRLYQDNNVEDIYSQYQGSDSDTASTASSSTASASASASLSSVGSMGQDMLPSIDEYLRKEYQTALILMCAFCVPLFVAAAASYP